MIERIQTPATLVIISIIIIIITPRVKEKHQQIDVRYVEESKGI
jgi:competence protein ComGC